MVFMEIVRNVMMVLSLKVTPDTGKERSLSSGVNLKTIRASLFQANVSRHGSAASKLTQSYC